MQLSLSTISALLVAVANASPLVVDISRDELAEIQAREHEVKVNYITSRQTVGTTANEFLNGGCRNVIFICARGSSQSGNFGQMPCPQTANALKNALGTSVVAAQGVSYSASLEGNFYSGGCPPAEAANMAGLITDAVTSCPSAKIVVSGYSQGAAMVHRSVEQLSTAVKARVYAAVTYGDTQNAQDGERIPSFDTVKTLIICNNGDKVCDGTLDITSAHLDYTPSVPTAVSFIRSKLGL